MTFTCGVPQGSVLGPLLFIITVNSLSQQLNTIPEMKHVFFADDLTIITRGSKEEIKGRLQRALDIIGEWSTAHYMEVSAPKTKYTVFKTKKPSLELKLNGKTLKMDNCPKLLGISFQMMQGVRQHVESLHSNATQRLRKLNRVATRMWGPSKDVMRSFFMALVQSKVLYGAEAWWDITCDSLKKRLEGLQYQGAKIITGVPQGANRQDLLYEARLQDLDEIVVYRQFKQLYKELSKPKGDPTFDHQLVEHLKSKPEIKTVYRQLTKQSTNIEYDGTPLTTKYLRYKPSQLKFNVTPPNNLRADDPQEKKQEACEQRVAQYDKCEHHMYTDGSVSLMKYSAGAAILYQKAR
ncbi:hypothetical protein AGDE_10074 [Angomonas deanei]|uniref:Reverse transcriptase (RNA-dependent DNA polymerase), putative n=1 Tax=Angomonas deanei TaxID=59799 RepID=A0A7G2CMW5_9TRYP|nr:hypothetical protein AGDE_10074 [Angomonas deanei]CAD2220749.1 Reverse transcriptase (RNA-dependent DNA polymerase), putative [Angomonas deanei]|eukprot:EPY29202.1 hypothetical protein AGDE_10074 [Angomonas deanei]